jgi:hypothetical protein
MPCAMMRFSYERRAVYPSVWFKPMGSRADDEDGDQEKIARTYPRRGLTRRPVTRSRRRAASQGKLLRAAPRLVATCLRP